MVAAKLVSLSGSQPRRSPPASELPQSEPHPRSSALYFLHGSGTAQHTEFYKPNKAFNPALVFFWGVEPGLDGGWRLILLLDLPGGLCYLGKAGPRQGSCTLLGTLPGASERRGGLPRVEQPGLDPEPTGPCCCGPGPALGFRSAPSRPSSGSRSVWAPVHSVGLAGHRARDTD